MTFEVEGPSGARFLFKEIGGEQIIQIGDRGGANASDDTLLTILSGCCTGIVDPGPYPHLSAGGPSPGWARLLTGDMMTCLLRLRVASFGDVGRSYDFTFTCEHCRKVCGAAMDLVDLLEHEESFRKLPQESFDALVAGELLTARIPARYAPRPVDAPADYVPVLVQEAITVTFDLHRPAQDVPVRALLKSNNRIKVLLPELVATQLKSVSGLVTAKNNEPVRDLKGLWAWSKKQSADVLDNLLAQFRAADCGVDPVVNVWCDQPDCGKEQRITLPFGRSFFNPRSGATKKASTTKPDSSASSSPA